MKILQFYVTMYFVLNYFLWRIQLAFKDLGDSALFINLKTSADALRKTLSTVLFSLKKPLPCLVILSWQKIRECLGAQTPPGVIYFTSRSAVTPPGTSLCPTHEASFSPQCTESTIVLYHIGSEAVKPLTYITFSAILPRLVVHLRQTTIYHMCTRTTFCFPNYYRCSFKILIIVTGNQQIFQHLFSGPLPIRGDGLQGVNNYEGIHNAAHPNSKGSP